MSETIHGFSYKRSYHVRIVPVSGTSCWDQNVLIVAIIVDDASNTLPRVVDVVKIAPEVAYLADESVVWLVI